MTSFMRASLALCTIILLFGCADRAEVPQQAEPFTRPCLGDERVARRCYNNRSIDNSSGFGIAGDFGLLMLPVALLVAGYNTATAPSRADQAAARRVIQDETRAR